MKLKEAMKAAKATRKSVRVTEPTKIEAKVNTSIRLDLEVLNWCKSEGEKQGIPYTTFINSILKNSMSGQETLEARVSNLEKMMKKLAR